jgi:hypothetical protein
MQDFEDQENNNPVYRLDHQHVYDQKMGQSYKSKRIHVPRYLIVVLWGLLMTFVVYTYAQSTMIDLDQSNKLIESATISQTKVRATIQFLPNEQEPQLAPVPF